MNPSRPSPLPSDARPAGGADGSSLTGDATAANAPGVAPAGLEFLAPPQKPDEIGRLGPYRILGTLGAGGMGMVFRAEDPSLMRAVALKVMLPQVASNPVAKARFLREARSQAKVEHDNVIQIYLVSEDRGVPFLAMPLLKGQPLSAALKQNPKPPVNEVLRIGREMADGLAAAHERNLVHRDIKPANVWLEGNKRRVKILDFGLARFEEDADLSSTNEPVTRDGGVVGTPAYMSPEQARGEKVDARTDLFSLGVVLYQMATGELPFKGATTMAILMSLGVDTPEHPSAKNPAIPHSLGDLIMRLLAKPAGGRPPSAEAVVEAIRQIEAGNYTAPTPVMQAVPVANDPWADIDASDSSVVPPARLSKRAAEAPTQSEGDAKSKLPLIAGGVAALLLVLGLGGYFAFKSSPKPPAVVSNPLDTPTTTKPSLPTSTPVASGLSSGTIDLLALADLKTDVIRGNWERKGTDVVANGEDQGNPVLEFPYQPPDEYDVTVEFKRTVGENSGMGVLLNRDGRDFQWSVAVGGHRYGVEVVGQGFFNDPTNIRPNLRLINNRRYTARVEVRKDRVTGYLDGETSSDQRIDFSTMAEPGANTRLRDPSRIGIGISPKSSYVFHRVAVTEVTGKGSVVRGIAPPAVDPHFRAAVGWLLSIGAQVQVIAGGKTFTIRGENDLTPGVRLSSVRVPTKEMPIADADLKTGAGLGEAIAARLKDLPADAWSEQERRFQLDRFGYGPMPKEGWQALAACPGLQPVRHIDVITGNINDLVRTLPMYPNLKGFGANAAFGGTDDDLKALSASRGLERIDLMLGRNTFSAAGLASLRNLKLTSLTIAPAFQVGDDAIPVLAGMTSLTNLKLIRSKLTEEGVKKLAAALPACKIVSDYGTFEPHVQAPADAAFFNGKDLTGWKAFDMSTWTVEDGEIVARKPQGGYHELVFQKPARDFELTFDARTKGYREDGKGFSSLRFRNIGKSEYAGVELSPFPARLFRIEGGNKLINVAGKPQNEIGTPNTQEYHRFSLRVLNNHVTITFNDTVTVDGDFPELPKGGELRWVIDPNCAELRIRNLRFTDLSKPANGAFVPIFNGKDLTGWEKGTPAGNWTVENGQLFTPSAGYLCTTRGDYGDFHLRASVKCGSAGNGGIYFRAGKPLAIGSNYEAQIAGATNPDSQKTGSLYKLASVKENLVPANEWFDYEIIARGKNIRLLVNGKETANFTESRENRRETGYIVLQVLAPSGLAFRKIEIAEGDAVPK